MLRADLWRLLVKVWRRNNSVGCSDAALAAARSCDPPQQRFISTKLSRIKPISRENARLALNRESVLTEDVSDDLAAKTRCGATPPATPIGERHAVELPTHRRNPRRLDKPGALRGA